jgi:hypothetical protein
MLLEKVLVHVQPSAINGSDDNALSPNFHRVFKGDDTVLESWSVLKDTVVAFPVAEELHPCPQSKGCARPLVFVLYRITY